MDRFLNFNLSAWRCKESTFFLACAWFSGLISGALFSISASDFLLPTMRAAISGCVSITGLLSAMLLPLLFSAFAVFISQLWLLYPIAFCKAFLFTYLGFGLLAAYGSAGWLIQLLLMFGDLLMLPFLWWFWLKCLNADRRSALLSSSLTFGAALLFGSIDYCVVSPFLATLIS